MVVQHNLTAMNSNRMLGVTTKQQAKTTEKLSSGYKINRAADDAAGLAISEKMRKQIRGLTQASANAQDGISAVQTAEGALTEVHDMLQRINELAVKAANGTQSESDRQAIQSEVDQLVTEIDRVAETTKFNETYLLKGDKSVAKGYSYSYNAVKADKAATAEMDTDSATGLTAKVIFEKGAAAADQNALAKALRDQGMSISVENGKYEVTLNGKAATNYKVNKESDSKFEITDLRENKIATITASGGYIGSAAAGGTAKIGGTASTAALYDENGKALDNARLAEVLDAGKKVYTAAVTTNALKMEGVTPTSGSTEIQTVDVTDDTTFRLGTGTQAKVGTYTYHKVGFDLGNGKTVDTAGWYNSAGEQVAVTMSGTTDLTAAPTDKVFSIKVTAANLEEGDKIVIKDKNLAVKDTNYTYTQGGMFGEGKRSAVVTASEIGAAENKDDVARFYDKDGNAISQNSLGNYFSVLAPGGKGAGTLIKTGLVDVDGVALDTDDKLTNTLNADGKVYTTAPTRQITASNNATVAKLKTGAALASVSTVKVGDVFTFNNTAGLWQKKGDSDPTKLYTNTQVGLTVADGTNTGLVDGETLTIGMVNAGIEAQLGTDYNYTPAERVAARAGAQLYDAVGNKLTMTDAAENVASNKNLTGVLNLGLHVGADSTSDNQIELNVEAMSAKGLGLNGLKVGGVNSVNALDAIETVKEAISKVSAQRSTLGAVQNRLEHTINNLDNVVENTTSAESAIRDTDMATTMVQYSKNNILAQAGTSMLAQANQSNQSVLSLLQ